MKAESYVYRRADGSGYVGRHVVGSARLIANPGAEVDDEVVESLGLDDLADHTDYDAVNAEAVKAKAPVTYRASDGKVKVKVAK